MLEIYFDHLFSDRLGSTFTQIAYIIFLPHNLPKSRGSGIDIL